MNTIAVIDYGMGNLRSVAKALECVAPEVTIQVTNQAEQIHAADRIVFPGVGALRDCMAELERLALIDVLREVAASKPFFGICLGMQALLDRSDENGGTAGLGLIAGEAEHFAADLADATSGELLKIPHMGWNQVQQTDASHPMWAGIEQNTRFYFVHSYFACLAQSGQRAGSTHYGADFTSAICAENVFAVQFHPEKSQQAGLRLLQNFVRWDGLAN